MYTWNAPQNIAFHADHDLDRLTNGHVYQANQFEECKADQVLADHMKFVPWTARLRLSTLVASPLNVLSG